MSRNPKVLLVHPGVQHAPRLAEQLERQGMLYRFWTGWAKAGGGHGSRDVDIPTDKLRKKLWLELLALTLKKTGLQDENVWRFRNRLFQQLIPEGEFRAADVVIGFDTASEILAEKCKKFKKPLVLDQTTPARDAKKKIFRELGLALPVVDEKNSSLVEAGEWCEQNKASIIILASSFCQKTFKGAPELLNKTRVLPYGFDEKFLGIGQARRHAKPVSAPRFLYVGNLGLHKGIQILTQAWSSIRGAHASLRVVGAGPQKSVDELRAGGISVLGQMDLRGVLTEMGNADVLLFPSYFEGFGRVILEGMAAGLAVITTSNTGGPDVIDEGKEGFIVPAGSVEALSQKMKWCLRNPEKVSEMGRAAHRKASGYTWERYGQAYAEIVREVAGKRD